MKHTLTTQLSKLTTHKQFKFELIFIAITAVIIACCILPAMRSQTWPQGTDFDHKTQLYAKHMKQGDILPIWSSDDAYGIGSPLPLYYHKTFYYLSGPLLVITNSVKISILIAVSFFMLVGAYGMRFALRKFTDHREVLLLVPQTLLLANYTFTNWLVRDDMAEFAALMIAPWLIWWCLKLLIDKKFSLSIAAIMFFLINAHNIVALFGVVPLAIATIICIARERKSGLQAIWKPALIAPTITIALLAPMLILEKIFLANYDPSKVTQLGFLASSNFRPLGSYFSSNGYTWLNPVSSITTQIDLPIVATLITAAVLITGVTIYQRNIDWIKTHLNLDIVALFGLSLAIYAVLQLDETTFLYHHLHFMEFLQFPWRLLTYLTLLGILFATYLATRVQHKLFLTVFSVFWLGSFLLLSPAFKTMQHGYIGDGAFGYRVPSGQSSGKGAMMGIGEYLPRVYQNDVELKTANVTALYAEKSQTKHEAEVLSGGSCDIKRVPPARYESLTQFITIGCEKPARVALPVSYNIFTTITNQTTGHKLNYRRDNSDPRIIIDVPTSSTTPYKLQLPNVQQVLKTAL